MASECAQGTAIPICLLVWVHTLHFKVLLLMLRFHSSYLKVLKMVSSDTHVSQVRNMFIACQNSADETEDTISPVLTFVLFFGQV
jgi:hypothetical protein